MAIYNGPKCRLCRREGKKLFLKGDRCISPKCPVDRKGTPPGQHGLVYKRRPTDFAIQLREKQKIKRTYGILERQFRRYFEQALKAKGQTGVRLLQLLETRLDRVLYLSGLVQAKKKARQYVVHGHVLVNGQKVSIPSYVLKKDDVVTFDSKTLGNAEILKYLNKKGEVPAWLERKGPVAKVARIPGRDDIDLSLNEQLVVEFYSR